MTIIALAKYIHDTPSLDGRTLRHILVPLFLAGLPVLLVAAQPDLGTALIIGLISATVVIIARLRMAELVASANVPSPFVHEDRRTIGVRIPGTALCEKLLWALGKPLLTATAKSRSGDILNSAIEIKREYGKNLDLILDAGTLSGPPSTVVSLAGDFVTVLREGRGPSNKLIT